MNPGATMGAPYSYNGQQFWLQADDWQKEGLRDGFRQEYNTTISGASDKVNYYTSFGYLDQQGIQVGSSQKRLSTRVKLDYQAKKWLKVGTNFNYTKYDNSQTSEGTVGTGTIWSTIKTLAPIYPVYLRDAKKNIMDLQPLGLALLYAALVLAIVSGSNYCYDFYRNTRKQAG